MLTKAQAEAVAVYLLRIFPGSGRERQHSYTSAWQMASEALDALGYAEETTWGFVLRDQPVEPEILPRWDDASVVVLRVAEQAGRIRMAGYHRPQTATGPTTADILTSAVLEALGLVRDRRWTNAATEVLWRVAPKETVLDFRSDARLNRVQQDEVPADIAARFDQLGKIQSEIVRRNELEHVFFERWRLNYGWLTDESGGRALSIFHDPVAAEAASRFTRISA